MPSFILNTNIPRSSIPAQFITELSAVVAQTVGKSEDYVTVHVNPDQLMTFGGSTEPCAQCTLVCIGRLGLEENRSHSAVLMDKINTDLKIPKDRMYISFIDMARQDIGFNGKTFA